MDDKGLKVGVCRNRTLDRAKLINMNSFIEDFGLNVWAEVIRNNFNEFSFGWLKLRLNKDLYQMESEMLDIVRENVEK